ncbi:diguanylate cyclase domain-containing protein [Calothrix sp. 336/3]|uniref:diguanylate cyclase domain-containing protein n=1 Tax=Calothrix sp. 336/3 TaxID=1337936 RepID=UPI000624A71C|nr:PleD family two-component system response regulator [Calothrix sp. 336/3]AKG23599.1 diguanylate cyclase [Calothrix sp. 336/3]
MNQQSANTEKANILIVDDKLDNLRVLSTILTTQGYQVRKALNGQMALIACQTQAPDLILLDINMPDMSGYKVCQHLKSDSQTSEIPIIFISVLDDVIDKVKGMKLGGVDYITKPFQCEEVLARVHNQLVIKNLQNQLQATNSKLLEQNSILRSEIAKRRQVEEALRQANQQLQDLVWSDSLTQVANRRYLDDYLQREWQRSARDKISLAFVLCDIDYFKYYNDTYGHIAGDNCLKQVAHGIQNAVRRPADLVARYGGEEFAVILPNTTLSGAIRVVENIQMYIRDLKIPHRNSPISQYLTLSIGIAAIMPHHQYSPENLIAASDKALYQAKEKGRNLFCAYTAPLQNALVEHNSEEGNIQCGLENMYAFSERQQNVE